MAFHNVTFPDDISYNSAGGPQFKTDVLEGITGLESRNSRWSYPRHRYDIAYGVKTLEQLVIVKEFWLLRRGAANSFRFKDFLDRNTAGDGRDVSCGGTAVAYDDQQIGTGDGSTTVFQLTKTYTDAAASLVRKITKPVSGTVLVGVNGSAVTSGWSLDYNTGQLTFAVAPASGAITWGGEFDVPVRCERFDEETMMATIQGFEHGEIPGIEFVEVLEEGFTTEELNYGGGREVLSADHYSVSVSDAFFYLINMSAASKNVVLPDPAGIGFGGPIFAIGASSGSNTFTIRDHLGNSILSVAAGQGGVVCLSESAAGQKNWYVI